MKPLLSQNFGDLKLSKQIGVVKRHPPGIEDCLAQDALREVLE